MWVVSKLNLKTDVKAKTKKWFPVFLLNKGIKTKMCIFVDFLCATEQPKTANVFVSGRISVEMEAEAT